MAETPHTEEDLSYGLPRRVVKCSCGRQQKDIGQESLEHIGWRIVGAAWKCPFCTGNTDNLNKIVDGRGLA
jgi:hypothetical protein